MGKTRILVTGMAALATVAAMSACSGSATTEATSSAAPTPAASSAAPTSASPATGSAAAHNQADMNFAHMMIPHHEQAIEMSDIILGKQGIDPRVVDLAKQIKAAQGPEIEQMRNWMTQWGMPMSSMPSVSDMPDMDHGGMHGSGPDTASPTTTTMPMPGGSMMPSGSMMPGMGGMAGMHGMLSPAQMDALRNANGVEASKLFLTGMIEHHQGALTMAQDEIKNGQSADAIALAESILDSQQKEIDAMNQILASL